jgi:hypothetical protein
MFVHPVELLLLLSRQSEQPLASKGQLTNGNLPDKLPPISLFNAQRACLRPGLCGLSDDRDGKPNLVDKNLFQL